jgi:ATP-dependent Clp protease ATP-binding subunit ClpA
MKRRKGKMIPARVTNGIKGSRSSQRVLAKMSEIVIGQPDGLGEIARYVEIYQANLSPDGRPAGIFMLLGPTGTGKTRTVEALATVLHGSPKNLLRIDCGEFQMEHEVAKLIGAPPGYLGHRETVPVLTQMKLNQVMSEQCNLAIVLFDEIEKACPSMMRLLLGILDRGVLRLGDNTTVQFERTFIVFTSNLGYSRQGSRNSLPGVCIASPAAATADLAYGDCMGAVKQHFAPEFINRIDAFCTYKHLTAEEIHQILDIELQGLADHIARRMGDRRFFMQISKKTRQWIAASAFSEEYGARNLKRFVQREMLSPLAGMLVDGEIPNGSIVRVSTVGEGLEFSVVDDAEEVAHA